MRTARTSLEVVDGRTPLRNVNSLLRREDMPGSLESMLQEIEARFVVKPISSRACARTLQLPASYSKDPADRLIGATALVEGLS